jgi:hypothetical protein
VYLKIKKKVDKNINSKNFRKFEERERGELKRHEFGIQKKSEIVPYI